MSTRECCCSHDISILWRFFKAGNILGNRSAKEFHILWQIANEAPDLIRIPVMHFCAIEAHGPGYGFHRSNEMPDERRFARPAWSNNAEHLSWFNRETDISK